MSKRVKFDTQEIKQQKVNSVPRKVREQPLRRDTERKNTIEKETGTAKKKQIMGFEEFLKKKPSKNEKQLSQDRNSIHKRTDNKPSTKNDENMKVNSSTAKASNLKKDAKFKEKQVEHQEDGNEPKEVSLENIFDSKIPYQDSERIQAHPTIHPDSIALQNSIHANNSSVANKSQAYDKFEIDHTRRSPDTELRSNIAAAQAKDYLMGGGDDVQGLSKNIRGTFKKEIYGTDEYRKKENQLRMKRELEKQMEDNRLKKDEEKRKKAEEERIEQEKYQMYLEKEKQKKDEEERKEQEAKKKKEMFTIQQAALLEEYKTSAHADKRSKVGKKSTIIDPPLYGEAITTGAGKTSQTAIVKVYGPSGEKGNSQSPINIQHAPFPHYNSNTSPQLGFNQQETNSDSNFGPARRMNPNQSVSPPTVPIEAYAQLTPQDLSAYHRLLTPMTNFTSNDSIPIEKNVLENLLKENQGLKQEANRNNIILDFLTNVLVKKQQASNNPIMQNSAVQGYFGPNPRLIEEPRTAEVYPSTQAREQWASKQQHPSTNHSKKKPFRINTPLAPQPQKGYQAHQNAGLSKQDSAPSKIDPHGKHKKPKPAPNKYVQPGGMGRDHAMSSMLEEFQDLDNFKNLPQGNDYGGNYQYFDNARESDSRFDYRVQDDVYEDPWPVGNQDYQHGGHRQNSHAGHRGAYNDSEGPHLHTLPPVNNKTDIKSRSEKYKNELAYKLSKIRDELNVKDTKIDNLLSRIGAPV